ncbi:MAG: YggT family protein, partial [Chroococcidiopsis sp.]
MRDDDRQRHEEIRLREAERRVTLASRNATVSKLVQIIYFLAGALGMLLLLRMILRLFGANPDNTFAQFIYNLS